MSSRESIRQGKQKISTSQPITSYRDSVPPSLISNFPSSSSSSYEDTRFTYLGDPRKNAD